MNACDVFQGVGRAALLSVMLLARIVGADDAVETRTVVSVVTPADKPIALLTPLVKLGPGPGTECSGIVRSRSQSDLFWLINDSGNEPRVFPIRRTPEGETAIEEVNSAGVLIQNATNIDWEDIAADGAGRLIVCDVGNNLNGRRDLCLYMVDEPAADAGTAEASRRLRVRYPDQNEFPAAEGSMNFDCEAVFVADGKIHLLTKHRSDQLTNLYRLDAPKADEENVLTQLGTFDSHGAVTAADASSDGLRMVFITYTSIWMFERDDLETSFLDGRISWAPYLSVQMESVCFADDETLLLVDEKLGMVFELPLSELTQVR